MTGECDCCGMWSTTIERIWDLDYMETFAVQPVGGAMKMKKIRNPQIW